MVRRQLLNLLAGLSLLLSIGSAAAWVDSQWYSAGIGNASSDGNQYESSWSLGWDSGYLTFFRRVMWTDGNLPERLSRRQPGWFSHNLKLANNFESSMAEWCDDMHGWHRLGLYHFNFVRGGRPDMVGRVAHSIYHTQRFLAFPIWWLILLFTALPALRLIGFIRNRRRTKQGHCPHCGYDLRATPDRCPECGAVPSLSPAGK